MERDQEGRSFLRVGQNVQRLLDNAAHYDVIARLDDQLGVNETTKMPAVQPGAASLLHSKWQEEGTIDDLTREECMALGKAGFRINKDRDGYWAFWREKRLQHLWLFVGAEGVMTAATPYIQGVRWDLIGSFVNPVVPYFEGYHITMQDVLREAFTVSILAIRDYVPNRIFTTDFFQIVRELCDEAIVNMDLETGWVDSLIFKRMAQNSR